MQPAATPQNRFVLRTETGHPGYRNTVILATAENFKDLSSEINQLAETGHGRIDHYYTEEKVPNPRGTIGFQLVTEDELNDLQQPSPKNIWLEKIWSVVFVLICVLSLYGGYTLMWKISSLIP